MDMTDKKDVDAKVEEPVADTGEKTGDKDISKIIEAAKEFLPPPGTEWQDRVKITITNTDTAEVTELKSRTGVVAINNVITDTFEKMIEDDDKNSDITQYDIKITIDAAGDSGIQHVMFDGELSVCLKVLASLSILPNHVMAEFMRLAEFMCLRGALKGVIITAVLGDAMPAGFAYITSHNEVTNEDLVTFAGAAEGQASALKDELKKRNPFLKFPADEPRIII